MDLPGRLRRARPGPVHRPGLAHRRGADARLHERASRSSCTRETGEMHFFSRSRQELWHKGATSGNTLAVRALRYDCDGDALLALVEPAGPGLPHRRAHLLSPRRARAPGTVRGAARRSSARSTTARAQRPAGSYTVDAARRSRPGGAKVEEEAEEVARAAREESDERVARGGRRRALPPGGAAAPAATCAWPTPNGCWMAVAA